MMNKRQIFSFLIILILAMSLCVPAFADEENPTTQLIAEVQHILPESNITVVSNASQETEKGTREFIIVESRNGHFFYIVIDKTGSTEKAYFLNQVDEADLIEILDEEGFSDYTKCTCSEICEPGYVDTDCLICRLHLENCKGTVKKNTGVSTATESRSFSLSGMGNSGFIVIGLIAGLAVLIIMLVALKKNENNQNTARPMNAPRSMYPNDKYYDDDEEEYLDDE